MCLVTVASLSLSLSLCVCVCVCVWLYRVWTSDSTRERLNRSCGRLSSTPLKTVSFAVLTLLSDVDAFVLFVFPELLCPSDISQSRNIASLHYQIRNCDEILAVSQSC